MAHQRASLAKHVLPLITAAIAFLDTDAAFGPEEARTLRAKVALRTAADRLTAPEKVADPPRLRVTPSAPTRTTSKRSKKPTPRLSTSAPRILGPGSRPPASRAGM